MNLLWMGVGLFVLAGALFVLKVALVLILFDKEIEAAMERDPSATSGVLVALTYSGFHAIVLYRISHFLKSRNMPVFARLLSQWGRFLTGIEIHPGAQIARGFFIDHGMGVVIGETTVIGENATLYQGVTLGGTGKQKGKRHPTIGRNVVIGAGAKVLGNIFIGDNVLIGANAVVVRDVPAQSTVVGVPGRITSREGKRLPGINLDHTHLPDPLSRALEKLQHEIDFIEGELKRRKSEGRGK